MLRFLSKWMGVIAKPRPFRRGSNPELKIEATLNP